MMVASIVGKVNLIVAPEQKKSLRNSPVSKFVFA
jgi:hypothetical protein